MRKDWLSIQVARSRASLDGVQIVLSAHQSSAVVISQHHSMGAADHHRSIVIANDRAPMMDDAGGDPLDGRHGKVGG
jgi:hypothetical protein